tara:strand:+ start:3772 stop:5559 length:1788 start_codon:yes stop_codon:yes gene_type:complete
MALVLADRVKETTTTTGTGTYTLAGAVTGFESFGSIGNSNTTYYCCTDGTDFEVGVGTYTSSGTTLARTTILQSSNSDSAVNWSAGTRSIFCTQPAEKAVFLDADGKVGIGTDDPQQLLHVAYSSSATDLTAGAGSDLSTGMRVNNTNTTTNSFASIDLRANNGDVRLASVFKGANQSDFVVLVDKAGGFTLEEALRVSSEGDVTITSSDADANPFPTLSLYRNSSSPADFDDVGQIQFHGENDAGEKIEYARIDTKIIDASDGTEDGRITLGVLQGGSYRTYLEIGSDQVRLDSPLVLEEDVTLRFEGSTDNAHETTVTVTDPTADRTITLPDATGTVALTSDIPSSGISSGNVATFTSGAVDNDFLRIDGTAIEGRSASEVLSDIAAMPLAGGTFTGDVTLTDTDAGSSEGPLLILNRDSSSPADSDVLGKIKFLGDNDAGESITYGSILAKISDNTDGTEDGNFIIQVAQAGSSLARLTMKGNSNTSFSNANVRLDTGVNLLFEGATANSNETTLTVVDPTADRTITLPDVTGTVLTTGNSDTPTTTTSSSDADFVLVDDGGTMKKITPANLGITAGAASIDDATALAIALG